MSGNFISNVSQADFQQQVIQRSHQTLVLVDFWAPWCGPCRMLTPTLEKLAGEFNGRFHLAKVNTDQNQQISMQYGVRGIPNVKAFRNGRVVDEFVGAQPEAMVRQFIQRHAPASAPSQPRQTARDGNGAGPAKRLKQAQLHLRRGQGCAAKPILQQLQDAKAQQMTPLADFLCRLESGQSISQENDLNVAYQQVAAALKRNEPSAALYNLLMALYQESPARKRRMKQVMEGLFVALGEESDLVRQYRRQLANLNV
jgi:putative thioredoxin